MQQTTLLYMVVLLYFGGSFTLVGQLEKRELRAQWASVSLKRTSTALLQTKPHLSQKVLSRLQVLAFALPAHGRVQVLVVG